MKPISMYKVTSICKPCKVKGTNVYGQVERVISDYNRNKLIVDANEKKVWVEVNLACVELNKKEMYYAVLPGFDELRKIMFSESKYQVYGKVKALIDIKDNDINTIIGSFIKIENATWITEYGKANSYYLTRFSKPITQNNKQVFPLIALNIETKRGIEEEFIDVVENGKIRENKGNRNNPICGVEEDLPERPSPAAISVDSEYQPLQSTFNSLLNEIKREDGTAAVMNLDNVRGADLGVFNEESLPFMKRNTIVKRDTFKEIDVEDIIDNVTIAEERLKQEYDSIVEMANEYYNKNMVAYCDIAKGLITNWDKKPEGMTYARTGRKIFLDAIEKVIPEWGKHKRNGSAELDDLLQIYGQRLVTVWSGEEEITDETDCLKMLVEKRYNIYLVILKGILGIRCDLLKIYEINNNIALMNYILEENPYILSYIHSNISLHDMDRLAMFTDKFANDEQIFSRGLSVLIGYMRGTLKSLSDNEGSSIFSYANISKQIKSVVNFNLNREEFNNLKETDSILPSGKLAEYRNYINKGTSLEDKKKQIIGNTEWKEEWDGSWNRSLRLSDGNLLDEEMVIDRCLDTGICTEIEHKGMKFYADTKILKQNVWVYAKLREINEQAGVLPITDTALMIGRLRFESIKQSEYGVGVFHLEDQQARALKLVHNGVIAITGVAGSGKTTTAEALVYVLENLYGVEGKDILFVAPTGKAANRLKEVVKRETRTIHSAFRIGVVDDYVNEMTYTNKANADLNKKVIIVDECSMISLDLMYTMLMNIKSDTRVIFLGDIEQLPPIAVGKPFSDILHFVPTVMLKTSKRAAENSIISKNANLLINTNEVLEDGADFRIISSTEDEDIVGKIKEMCYFYGEGKETSVPVVNKLKGIGLKDVQIITPYKRKQIKSGTMNLNNVLHDIFNPYKEETFKVVLGDENTSRKIEFRVGDRVIHTENDSTKKHYKVSDGNIVEFIDGRGVMNGDVGYIKRIEHIRTLYGDEAVEESLYEDVETSKIDKTFIIFVEYPGIGAEMPYEIAYRVYAKEVEGYKITALLTSLEHLDLAYALTVHKMQGSQAKMVIVVWPSQRTSIMTKNMLYTAITRATDGVALIGNVKGQDSSVAYARVRDAMSRRLSLMDI